MEAIFNRCWVLEMQNAAFTNQISWFDVRNIPNEIDLMTDEEWDNYDP